MIVGLVAVVLAVVVVTGAVVLSGDDATEPPGAIIAVQDDHLPVDPIETIPARLDLIGDTGVTTTRVDLHWAQIAPSEPADPRNPADPAYDWSRADLIMLGLAERGVTPIVSSYNPPAWATGGVTEPGVVPNTLAPDPEAFADYMAALATRYRGDQVSAGGETLPEVRRFEIWNEPNLPGFLKPQFEGDEPVSLDNYADMAKAAYPAIKEANPDAIVIAGVGGPRSSTTTTGVGAIDWVRGLVERQIPLDAYSQHIYPAQPPLQPTEVVPSWSSIGRFLDELDAFRPGLPLYITEAGYTTKTTPFRTTAVTEDEQAEYLTQIYEEVPALQTERIRAVVWFNLQDNANWPAGLLREDLTEKPSYQAFLEAVRGQDGAQLRD
ncbi:MAG: cellulase family glycosylhydrolase [Thermoleophilia bacterium]